MKSSAWSLFLVSLVLAACSRVPSKTNAGSADKNKDTLVNPFAKQVYESVDEPIRVTFMSDHELEVKIHDINAVCDYSRERSVIRAVGTMEGTKRSFYFTETNGVLVNEVGTVLLGPEEFKKQSTLKNDQRKCLNNLKNIGLAMRIFATDYGDKFPFQVSQREGGTQEFCSADALGFDSNSARHFLVLSNELMSPKILVCPSDRNTVIAADFLSLQNTNVTYVVRTGGNLKDGDSQEVLAKCPIHGNVVFCDTSVRTGPYASATLDRAESSISKNAVTEKELRSKVLQVNDIATTRKVRELAAPRQLK
jgi:hypothetical protein